MASKVLGFLPRPLALGIVLSMLGADAWLCHRYWPMLTEPIETPVISGAKANGTGVATRPVVARLPGVIRRTAAGTWSVIGQDIEMIATPTEAGAFSFRYRYIRPDAAEMVDWRAMLRLQGEINAARRSAPPGLSREQATAAQSMIAALAPPLKTEPKQKIQAELAALAGKAAGKPVGNAALRADESTLLNDLNAAAAEVKPALREQLERIKALVGTNQWAKLSGERSAPGTRPMIGPATMPVGLTGS